jgi:hypothetical protein
MNVITEGAEFEAFMSANFFFNPQLGHGGISFAQAGALNLHAIGLADDGQPIMSKDVLFFTNGFSSMTRMSKELASFRQNNWGYLVKITKQLAKKPNGFRGEFTPKTIWQVRSVKSVHLSQSLPKFELVVRQDKITDLQADEVLLMGIDGHPGQYVYIQRKIAARSIDFCWLCPPHKKEEC